MKVLSTRPEEKLIGRRVRVAWTSTFEAGKSSWLAGQAAKRQKPPWFSGSAKMTGCCWRDAQEVFTLLARRTDFLRSVVSTGDTPAGPLPGHRGPCHIQPRGPASGSSFHLVFTAYKQISALKKFPFSLPCPPFPVLYLLSFTVFIALLSAPELAGFCCSYPLLKSNVFTALQ